MIYNALRGCPEKVRKTGEGEIARVSLRNARKESNDQLKKLLNEGLSEDLKKDTENKVQKLIDEFNDKVNILVKAREKDIMTI